MSQIKTTLKVIIFLLLGACGSDSGGNSSFERLSDLPNRELTSEETQRLTIDCADYDFSGSEPDAGSRCAIFSMRDSDSANNIDVGSENFSEQDLMDKLEIMFPDFDTAPIIIIESDGELEDGLTNNGFNIYLV